MIRLIYSHPNLQHCFTWTRLQWRMRFWQYKLILSLSPEVMDNLGTYKEIVSKHHEMCYLLALFGSTNLCQSAFTYMKIIKCKYRSTMTDGHLEACLRLASSSFCWTMQPWLTAFSASHQSMYSVYYPSYIKKIYTIIITIVRSKLSE